MQVKMESLSFWAICKGNGIMDNTDPQQTFYKSIRLPKVERFPCLRKDIKSAFKPNLPKYVFFNKFSKRIFDLHVQPHEEIHGTILAFLMIGRDGESSLDIYSIRKELYLEETSQIFRNDVLPSLSSWLNKTLEKPELSYNEPRALVVEWDNKNHIIHKVSKMK
jgi:hypothetical protein